MSPAPSRTGYGSNLPVIGNEHAQVEMSAFYHPQYEGALWILVPPHATNGRCSASPGMRLTFEAH